MFNILGSGTCVGDRLMTNDEFAKIIDTSDEWISTRTGIKQRYFSTALNTSDLAYNAARLAIERADINVEKISVIVVASISGDNFTPNTASVVQKKLGIKNKEIRVFDVNAACTGFIYALDLCANILKKGEYGLVIGAEVLSKMLDMNDRNTCFLFGDGAGAVIIEKADKEYYSFFKNEPDLDDVLFAKGLNFGNSKNDNFIHMNGNAVFKYAIRACCECINAVLEKSKMSIDEIDRIIPHQANFRIIKAIARELKIDIGKFFINLNKYGNTSSASIPIAFDEISKKEGIKKGDNIILVGFGAGLSMASILFKL